MKMKVLRPQWAGQCSIWKLDMDEKQVCKNDTAKQKMITTMKMAQT
jgi:hypothetical protein